MAFIDFAHMEVSDLPCRAQNGTKEYNAPEVYKNIERVYKQAYLSSKVDMFNLGVCLYQTMFSSNPFNCASIYDKRYKQLVEGNTDEFWALNKKDGNTPVAKLIESLLAYQPSKRPTLEMVMSNPWVIQLPQILTNEMRAELETILSLKK